MEEKNNQDLVVGSDGAMNDGSEKVQVKITPSEDASGETTSTESPKEPVDEVQTPPAMPAAEVAEPSATDETSPIDSSEVEVKQPPVEETEQGEESTQESPTEEPKLDLSSMNDSAEPTNSGSNAPGIGSTVSSETAANEAASQQNPAPKPHEHRNNKKLAVIMTLLIAFILAGGAVYMFMSAESNTEENPRSSNVETVTETEETPATVNDIDQVTEEADEAINSLEDSSDFSEEELSDQNLGTE